jgi:hypothetical protein
MQAYRAMRDRVEKMQANRPLTNRNVKGSLLSYVIQTLENDVMQAALAYIEDSGVDLSNAAGVDLSWPMAS